jgi:hypothetical protein
MSEYMRLALSRQGQELLQSLAAENGCIPLDDATARKELDRVR